jgi:hypothetical protein
MRPEDVISTDVSKSPYIRNTYDSWRLVPTSRPFVTPPNPKTKYVDIPGANGQLDFSTALTGYPVYEMRTGTWEFMIDHDNAIKNWPDTYSDIMDWLQGKNLACILEDDQSWYYVGRFHVSSMTHSNNYTTLQISYTLKPYKKSTILSGGTDKWLWDPFDFAEGVIPSEILSGITVNSNAFLDYYIYTKNEEEWYSIFGTEPVVPVIKIETADPSNRVAIKFQNNALNKPLFETEDLAAGTYTFRNIIFGGPCLEDYSNQITVPVYHPEDPTILMGDVDGDNKVRPIDASLILAEVARITAGDPPTFTERQNMAADLDLSGTLTSIDGSYCLKIAAIRDAENPYTRDHYIFTNNLSLSIQLKGQGTISFIFVPGRL